MARKYTKLLPEGQGGGGGGITIVDELPTNGEAGVYYALRKCDLCAYAGNGQIAFTIFQGIQGFYRKTLSDLSNVIPTTPSFGYVAESEKMYQFDGEGWVEVPEEEVKAHAVFNITDVNSLGHYYFFLSIELYEYKDGEYKVAGFN